MKKILKYYLKNNSFIFHIIAFVIYLYLKFSYLTSSWQIIMPKAYTEEKFNQENGILFAFWHCQLAYPLHVISNYKNIHALTSSHSDGKIIAQIASLMNYKIIKGSSNRDSMNAVKNIITQLNCGSKIAITPDGPRGPSQKNNSVMTKIAYKYNKKLFPIFCHASKYFTLNSWDRMMIPKPFSKIIVVFGEAMLLSDDEAKNKITLEKAINDLAKNQIFNKCK